MTAARMKALKCKTLGVWQECNWDHASGTSHQGSESMNITRKPNRRSEYKIVQF